jgi:hypothetical protein
MQRAGVASLLLGAMVEADLQRKTGAGEPAVAGADGSGRFERGASAEERTPTHRRTTR